MELENSFRVPVPVAEAWPVLLDVRRIAPCMPGATLGSVEGDSFEGTVKVKVGPIVVTYSGKAEFLEKDEAAHRVVISATGKETKGTGTANAKVTAVMVPDGDHTEAKVTTDLAITGKPAQFGRGVMADVSNAIIGQFASCLAADMVAGSAGESADAPSRPAHAAPEVLDLLGSVRGPILKRLLPVMGAVAVVAAAVVGWRRRG
jgi:uncharacterized protein